METQELYRVHEYDRPLWEVVYCLKFNLATSYLDAYNATGNAANLLRVAYETRDLKQWALEHIKMLLAECETTRAGRLLSTHARDVVRDSSAALGQVGLKGKTLTTATECDKMNVLDKSPLTGAR